MHLPILAVNEARPRLRWMRKSAKVDGLAPKQVNLIFSPIPIACYFLIKQIRSRVGTWCMHSYVSVSGNPVLPQPAQKRKVFPEPEEIGFFARLNPFSLFFHPSSSLHTLFLLLQPPPALRPTQGGSKTMATKAAALAQNQKKRVTCWQPWNSPPVFKLSPSAVFL